jgi:OPT oligopeptide transporter protein
MGIFLSKVLPSGTLVTFGYRWTMNAGKFSVKEHVLITIIASAGASVAYGLENVVAQKSSHFMVIYC